MMIEAVPLNEYDDFNGDYSLCKCGCGNPVNVGKKYYKWHSVKPPGWDEALYRDEQLLYWLYWGEGYDISKTAELLECSTATIYKYTNVFLIPRRLSKHKRGKKEVVIDRDWLYHQYVELKKHSPEIAKLVGCYPTTIRNKLRDYKIHIRSGKEHNLQLLKQGYNRQGRRIRINLSKEAMDFLNGELLGDGCFINEAVYKKNRRSSAASFRYSSKHKEYIGWISKTLTFFGIEQGGKINSYTKTGLESGISKMVKTNKYDNKLYTSYHYRSKGYLDLTELYNKWYLRDFSFCPFCEIIFHDRTVKRRQWQKYTTCPVCGEHRLLRKIIPKDLELTPVTLRQWFIGDGGNYLYNGGGIWLFLHAFLPDDIEFLKQKLEELGFGITVKDKDLRMKVKSARKFLKYIGKCPIECYKYKWEDNPLKGKKLWGRMRRKKFVIYDALPNLGEPPLKGI